MTTLLVPAAPTPAKTAEDLRLRINRMQSSIRNDRTLPLSPSLTHLLPNGLRTGAVYSVSGSATLAMALLAGPSAQGSWGGVLGLPNFGIESASELGIDLERLVLVPTPGKHWMRVLAAMADVLNVVIANSAIQLSPTEAARLSARLRERGSILIVLGPWPQAEATLRVMENRWTGLGAGYGYLNGRELSVQITERGMGRARTEQVKLPGKTKPTPVPAAPPIQLPERRIAG